jgi:predicted DNA-binding transcriptional regulator YafY
MRADRLISILLLLQSRRRVTARELAQRLEVSERTILRDMDALSISGIPVTAERGAGGGWELLEEYQTKLNGLTPGEIQSLFVGRPQKVLADLGLGADANAAWLKLRAALPAAVREQAEFVQQRILIDSRGWRDPSESATSLPVVLDALWRGRQLSFIYDRSLGEAGERTAHPLGLVARGSVWYLVAIAHDESRTYRVSRIREPKVLTDACIRPKGFDLATHWEASATAFREALPKYRAEFLVEASAMKWVRYRGWRVEHEEASGSGGRIRVRIRFDAEIEAVQFGLSLGGEAEVVEPEELRKLVAAAARALLKQYTSR